MNPQSQSPRWRDPRGALMFAPLAWLKLQFFCHAGETEIGGFGISAATNLLYIEEFLTVRQVANFAAVRFEDAAVADFFDTCVDRGLPPERFARIWCHTHPGESVQPSGVDEETFGRTFGACHWSLMFILGRTGLTYARLAFSAGPRGETSLPVTVDWSAWPKIAADKDALEKQFAKWREEYEANVACGLRAAAAAPAACMPNANMTVVRQDEPWLDERPWFDREPWSWELDGVSYTPLEKDDQHDYPF